MRSVRFSPHVQTENQGAVVLIAGDTQFIGYYLQQFFLQQKCRVIFWQDFSRQKVETIDYIFCLGEKKKEKIEALLKISEKFEAKFLLAFFKDEPLVLDIQKILRKKEIDGRIVELDYVYGPRMNFEKYQEVVQLIKVVKIKPIFVADVVYGLVRAMFTGGTAGKTFSLNNQTAFDWQPKVELEEGLKQTRAWFEKFKKFTKEGDQLIGALASESEKKEKQKPQKRINLLPRFSFLILLVIILSYPFYSLAFNFWWGMRNFQQAYGIAALDLEKAAKHAKTAERSFDRTGEKIRRWAFLFEFAGQSQLAYRFERTAEMAKKTAGGLAYVLQIGEQASFLKAAIFGQEETDIQNLIREMDRNFDFSYRQFSFVEGAVKSDLGFWQWVRKLGYGQAVDDQIQKLPEIKNLIVQAKKGIQLIPGLVGLERKKTYLVLLQNNMELRPTGGFIGSYALLTFDKGRLVDFEVDNVYNADGQLKGHVEPPATLRRNLGEAGWYLRDSNWDPDFPTSAARAAWFLEKEIGRGVDGVFGVNLFLVQGLLEAVGEVEIADYQEKINAANLFERAEYHAEANFFPGSTQKQDFLASLAQSLFGKIKEADQKTWFAIAKAIYQSVGGKNFLIYLTDKEAMTIVSDLGWDGRIKSLVCEGGKAECLVDYLMVVESNVGVNKANYFVKRRLIHQAKIDFEGRIEKTIRLTYQNTSQSEVFPGGRYKNYLRFYLPLGVRIKSVKIKNPTTNEVIEEIGTDQQDVEEAHEKKFFGFLVEVPIQESRLVEIVYSLAEKLKSRQGQYLLLQQKQPGIRDEEFGFWFIVPEKMTIVSTDPQTTLAGSTAVFTPEFNQDLVFDIRVVK